MFSEYFTRIKQMTAEDIQHVDILVDKSVGDIEVEEENFLLLKTLLQEKESAQLFEYRNSYARWYAIYGWDLCYSLSLEDFVDLVSHYTITGLLLEERVWESIVTYLHNRSIDQKDMEAKYAELRKNFLFSQEILYTVGIEKKQYTVQQCVVDISRLDKINNSLEQSEFFSQLQQKLESRISEGDFAVEGFVLVSRIRELVSFFIGVEPKNIWYIVDPYFYPQLYNPENIVNQSSPLSEQVVNESLTVNNEQKSKISYRQLYYNIIQELDSLAEDQKDEHIIMRLSEFSEEFDDEFARDLYYYDEQQEKFVWNEELLTSS